MANSWITKEIHMVVRRHKVLLIPFLDVKGAHFWGEEDAADSFSLAWGMAGLG